MFEFIRRQARRMQQQNHLKRGARARQKAIFMSIESLEGRQFLSASHFGGHHGGGPGDFHGGGGGGSPSVHMLLFSQLPTAIQDGLDKDAEDHGLADPTDSKEVAPGNSNGVETYSVVVGSTGATTRLTVDQNGNEITDATTSTTTFADLKTTDAVAATEISTIATDKSLTAPTDATVVNVVTQSDGTVTYSVRLDTTSGKKLKHRLISVDAAGDPVGNQDVPFEALSTTIQDALNANAPTGATALDASSTQNVSVETVDGVTLYTTSYTVDTTTTPVTVKADGSVGTLPTHTTTTYADLETSDADAATEIQTLATAEGAGTIATTQSVDVYTEASGTVLYSVTVAATNSTTSTTYNLTITVDADGNPTTLPHHGLFGGGFGGGHGDCGGDDDDSSSSDSGSTAGRSGSTTSTGASLLSRIGVLSRRFF